MFHEPNSEKIDAIQKEIKVPANLYVAVPKVNPEIWNKAYLSKKMQDLRMQHMLKREADVAVLLAKQVEAIMIRRSKLDDDEVEGKKLLEEQAMEISNAIALLGAASKESNERRRETLKEAIPDIILRKQLLKTPTVVDGVPTTYLFGDDLPEQIKTADESRRLFGKMRNNVGQQARHQNYLPNNENLKARNQKPFLPKKEYQGKNKTPLGRQNYTRNRDNYQGQRLNYKDQRPMGDRSRRPAAQRY